MIESNVINWLDFGDSAQNIDIYSKKGILLFFKFYRELIKNKFFPISVNIFFMIIFFIQLWTITIITVSSEGDIILEILDYLKKVTVFYEIITNELNYKKILIISITLILFDFILIVFTLLMMKKINVYPIIIVINLLNLAIYYYFTGPSITIFLINTLCQDGTHLYLGLPCYTKSHLNFFILSIIMLLLSILISFIYSFYCCEIDLITTNINSSISRINCNYELFCLVSKIIIFFLGSFVRINNNNIILIVYEVLIFLNCLIMSIYIYKYVYYYNHLINYLNYFGWLFSTWFSFCVLLKTLFHLECITNLIIIGWILITISLYKTYKMNEHSLITEYNIFEFKSLKFLEMYKNILLNKLREKNNYKSKIFLFGIIKKFEEVANNNPELNYQYHKLLNDKFLTKKYNKEDDLPILSIIYILYSFYLEKFVDKEEITLHFGYFLINNFNNPTFAMLLCSKLKNSSHKCLYYKYLLIEDIKKYLIYKLNKNSNKESIKHVQIGSVILYYLYIYLFKIKIYDAICNQIDYFDLLKSCITTNKTTENFLKSGKIILKSREEILTIWEKIIELNPFSDDYQKDYLIYLDTIIQDELLSREECKKYMLLKNSKINEKNNIYHRMFLTNTSSILLVDGYMINGKILYASQNFSYLFMYNSKELLNITIDDLLPNVIQTFHKELVNEALKFSNISYIYNAPKESLLKNKNSGLFNIKLFVKPVPNLNYGLIYYSFIQKINDPKFVILLDKDLKISGYTEMSQTGSSFTISNGFNITPSIIGYNIGLIIPDILPLIEYKNDEFIINKKNYELKGYLYPVEKVKEIKNKLDIILAKIKLNRLNDNNIQGEIENDQDIINSEFKELIKELNNQKIKPFSIFYKIQLFTFLEGKFKYYRVYINADIISNNENESLAKDIIEKEDEIKDNKNEYKSSISIKSKNNKKIILKINDIKSKNAVNVNDNDNSQLTLNGNNNNNNNNGNNQMTNNLEKKMQSNTNNIIENNEEENNKNYDLNNNDSFQYYDSNPYKYNSFNRLKNDILNKKEAYPLKIMFYLSFLFIIMCILFMIFDLYQNKAAFERLDKFLSDNLFFKNSKIVCASLYINGVNIRWASHSLFLNSKMCLFGDFFHFYEVLLTNNLEFLEKQKNDASSLEEDFKPILKKKNQIGLNVYKFKENEKYDFNFDNIVTFLINIGIKMIDTYTEYKPNDCKKIPKELELSEINLKNLIEMSYYIYNSTMDGYIGEEKTKKINQKFNRFPVSLVFFGIICLILLFFYIHYSLTMYNIEIYFLEKLINFTSTNFDNYIKKIDEIKKKLRNENNEDEDKGDDMDFNEGETKRKDEEEGFENIEEKKVNEKEEKRKKKSKHGNKQSKILQQRKKKLIMMKSHFSKSNIFFGIRMFIIMLSSLIYYIISMVMKNSSKISYLNFDLVCNSIFQVYKDSFDISLKIKTQLEIYENSLINCKTIGNFEKMKIPKLDEIDTPTIENSVFQITESSDFKGSTLEKFQTLFNKDSCTIISYEPLEYRICENFWSGVLLRGMEQAIIHMGVIIGNILDEVENLNDIKNNKSLYDLMAGSSFIEYEQFLEYFLLRAYNETSLILNDLREQKINAIISKMKILLIIYIIISFVLFGLFLYNIFVSKHLFNSFLNFICILPVKYIAEDESFYEEIIKFGKKYFF